MQTYVWTCIILFLASFTKGLSGFGAPLIAIPLLVIFLDIKTAVPIATLLGFFLSLLMIIDLRRHLSLKKIYALLIGAAPGIPLGVYFLKRLDKDVILLALGLILIAYSLYSLVSRPVKRSISQKWTYVFGLAAGFFGGGLGVPGPVIIVYTSLQDWTKDEIKVSMQGFFLLSSAIVAILHAASGLTGTIVLTLFGVSLPGILLGNYLGSHFYGRLDEAHYRKVILCLLGLLGAFMIYRTL
jgi:uncharacterized membrane protein YfcA